jgi:signal transduction histidine kinase
MKNRFLVESWLQILTFFAESSPQFSDRTAMKKKASFTLRRQFGRLRLFLVGLFVILVLIQGAIFIGIMDVTWGEPYDKWLPELAIASGALLVGLILSIIYVSILEIRTRKHMSEAIGREMRQWRVAKSHVNILQEMASTLSSSYSVRKVMAITLDVCCLALAEMDVTKSSLSGAVFLYEGDELVPVAYRGFVGRDHETRIRGAMGVVGRALQQAELTVTEEPKQDPELKSILAYHECKKVLAIPLRAGYQIFGVIVLGTDKMFGLSNNDTELFGSIADQAVVGLQNAQLYQELAAEKRRIIETEESARKELARALHDGPAQRMANIVMGIDVVRTMLNGNTSQVKSELDRVELLAKQTTKEIRSMLFTLRPMILETEGLSAAIEEAAKKNRELSGADVRFIGGKHGDILDSEAQIVVYQIVEEALNNANKYAKANVIEVRFWQEENLFAAHVQDNGLGFDTYAVNTNYNKRGSLGMVNMHERAARIDGSLQVDSAPGSGTRITLVVPLDKHGNLENSRN